MTLNCPWVVVCLAVSTPPPPPTQTISLRDSSPRNTTNRRGAFPPPQNVVRVAWYQQSPRWIWKWANSPSACWWISIFDWTVPLKTFVLLCRLYCAACWRRFTIWQVVSFCTLDLLNNPSACKIGPNVPLNLPETTWHIALLPRSPTDLKILFPSTVGVILIVMYTQMFFYPEVSSYDSLTYSAVVGGRCPFLFTFFFPPRLHACW